MIDFYKLFGIDRSASQQEIRSAYRRLARVWHPDLNPRREAEENFKAIGQGYSVLNNPVRRHDYDLALQHSEMPVQSWPGSFNKFAPLHYGPHVPSGGSITIIFQWEGFERQ